MPTFNATTLIVEVLSGEDVTLHCPPSNDNVGLQWTHENLDSRTQIHSYLLTILVTNVSDSGNYTCSITGLPDGITVSQTIILTVLPGKSYLLILEQIIIIMHAYCTLVCGRTNVRLSYGVLWPITIANSTAKVFCSEISPSFGFGPYATRNCTGNDIWGRVDTSQCSIRPTRQSSIVVYSNFIMPSSPEIDQVSLYIVITKQYIYALYLQLRKLYNNSKSVRGDLQTLSEGFEDRVSKRQTETSNLVPIVYTAQLLDDTISVEQVTQDIQNAISSGEIIAFNAVGMYACSVY